MERKFPLFSFQVDKLSRLVVCVDPEGQGHVDESNALVLPKKKREFKVKKGQMGKKLLSKKKRKMLEKILEQKRKKEERGGTRTGKRSFVSLFRLNLLMVVGVVVLGVEEEEDTEMEGEEGTMEDMEGIG